MKLEVKDACCGYDGISILKNISFTVESGDVFCLLGPNGSGKTTLFRAILGFLKLQGGEILLNGENISNIDRNNFAKFIGYVPQAHTPPFPYKVLDVVLMGRSPHIGRFSSPKGIDIQIAEECLSKLGIEHLRDRTYTEISGGERQLTLIARALAQRPHFLILDEPTSNLDFGNQTMVLKHINRIVKDGMGVIMTTHFPNHAFLCSTKIALIHKDFQFQVGTPAEIITEDNLRKLYNMNIKIVSVKPETSDNEVKCCIPII